MTLDGITLYSIVKELDISLNNARIDKVFMPAKDEVDLLLRAGSQNRRLKISINPASFRLHLTQHADKNPDTPPVFCMFLRKYITNATVERIYTQGFERVVFFELMARDEMGVKKLLTLTAELMGKNSNILLYDENGRIMESVKHVSLDVSRVRQILPGLPYSPPPGDKENPLAIPEEALAKIILEKGQKSLANHLSAKLQGLSQTTANEIIRSSGLNTDDITPYSADKLAAHIKGVFQKIDNREIRPHIAYDEASGKEFFSMLGEPQGVLANDLLDGYYIKKHEEEKISGAKQSLLKILQKHIEKREKKLQIQLETLEEAKSAETQRKYGDLITANIYRLKKGADYLDAEDYYDGGENIRIPLDKRFSPSANAQRYYKRYNKLKSAAEITSVQMEENSRELTFLRSVEISLHNSETLKELDEIKYELIKTGYLAERKGLKLKPQEEPSTPHEFLSADGFVVYAGKNNRQNDLLTLKYAGLNDTWLHIKDFPGAHVIIKNEGRQVPDKTLEEAAAIAAYLSRGKNADKIAIDYTQRRNVKKPSGAKPGMVIYENYRTIYIKPDAELFARLKARAAAKKNELQ